MNLKEAIEETLKVNKSTILSQPQIGFCCAGNIIAEIREKCETLVDNVELLYIIHQKFKEMIEVDYSFTWTKKDLEEYTTAWNYEYGSDCKVNDEIVNQLKKKKYVCPICTHITFGLGGLVS